MGRNSTREEILEVALDLFSVNGFEATSISQIADAVGIRKASLYSHFGSKQEILDTVMETVSGAFRDNLVFDASVWDDPEIKKTTKGMNAEEAAKLIQDQVSFVVSDPYVSRGRRMLTIEQFRDPDLAGSQTGMGYDDMLRYFEGMIGFLISSKTLRKEDPEIMAMQLASPVTAWINLCDREPGREDEVMKLLRRHVLQFFKVYGR